MTELALASGPYRYFGGAIETFALPYGTFIVIAIVLFYLYKRPHHVPRLKYLRAAHQSALGTREPGTPGVITLPSRIPASAPAAEADISVPGGQPPHESETIPQAAAAAVPVVPATDDPVAPPAADQPEGDA